jgi:hypothetical protein
MPKIKEIVDIFSVLFFIDYFLNTASKKTSYYVNTNCYCK